MDRERGQKLLDKYFNGMATDKERALIEAWYAMHLFTNLSEEDADYTRIKNEVWHRISPIKDQPTEKKWLWYKIAAAAIAILTVATLSYYWQTKRSLSNVHELAQIQPGETGATLTLADGRSIHLNKVGQGALDTVSGIVIHKSAEGHLVYEISAQKTSKHIEQLNTLSTDKGESFLMILPDRSKVWLNADSKLTFDANLRTAQSRTISLTGEAYFEVTKDNKPFIVKSADQEVQVVGTAFNVKAYRDDKEITTTLIEGKVNLLSGGKKTAIIPGEMVINRHGQFEKQQIDVHDAIAWKDGNFVFAAESLENIVKQIGRWYNIDFVFESAELKHEIFEAMVPRSIELSKLLQILESTNRVKFEIKNRTAYVKRK